MDAVEEVDITDEVLQAAKGIRHHNKSLDAIHLGTAAVLQVDFLATYDRNMAEVATKMGTKAGPLP